MMPLSVNGKMASVYRTLKIPNIYHTTDGGCVKNEIPIAFCHPDDRREEGSKYIN